MHRWEPFYVRAEASHSSARHAKYEWPFELFIVGNWDETVKGCRRCGVSYRLQASTSTQGSDKDVFAFAPVRIIRCPTVSSYDLLDPAMTQGKWAADTVEYSISIRHQAVAVGGLIPVDAKLRIDDPGVELKKASFYLNETHVVYDEGVSDVASFYADRLVEAWRLDIANQDQRLYTWQQCLPLPRIVSRCSPDFSIHGLAISHTLYFKATLLKDGMDYLVSSQLLPRLEVLLKLNRFFIL